jgi:hypothetical protein
MPSVIDMKMGRTTKISIATKIGIKVLISNFKKFSISQTIKYRFSVRDIPKTPPQPYYCNLYYYYFFKTASFPLVDMIISAPIKTQPARRHPYPRCPASC